MKVYIEGDLADWRNCRFYDADGDRLLNLVSAHITIGVDAVTRVGLDFGPFSSQEQFQSAELVQRPTFCTTQQREKLTCPDCKGTGQYQGFTKVETCGTCGGNG